MRPELFADLHCMCLGQDLMTNKFLPRSSSVPMVHPAFLQPTQDTIAPRWRALKQMRFPEPLPSMADLLPTRHSAIAVCDAVLHVPRLAAIERRSGAAAAVRRPQAEAVRLPRRANNRVSRARRRRATRARVQSTDPQADLRTQASRYYGKWMHPQPPCLGKRIKTEKKNEFANSAVRVSSSGSSMTITGWAPRVIRTRTTRRS